MSSNIDIRSESSSDIIFVGSNDDYGTIEKKRPNGTTKVTGTLRKLANEKDREESSNESNELVEFSSEPNVTRSSSEKSIRSFTTSEEGSIFSVPENITSYEEEMKNNLRIKLKYNMNNADYYKFFEQ